MEDKSRSYSCNNGTYGQDIAGVIRKVRFGTVFDGVKSLGAAVNRLVSTDSKLRKNSKLGQKMLSIAN